MSKAAYPYPPDEFDAPPGPDAPRGVHRAPRSAWSRWWPFLAILVVVPALAWGAVTLLAQDGKLPSLPGAGGAGTTPPATATAGTTNPAEAPPASASPTTEPTPTTPAPDLATPVSVLNGAGIGGLAARVSERLTAAGFTAVTPGNASGSTPVASTVFFGSEQLRSTADLVAQTIGVPTVVLSPVDAAAGITVVLRTDPET